MIWSGVFDGAHMSVSKNTVTNLLIDLLCFPTNNYQGEKLKTVINALRKQYDAIFGKAHTVRKYVKESLVKKLGV